jgi:hypothetical protein
MMFRMISSVPPAIRWPGALSSVSWNSACMGASPRSMTTPAAPCRSSAKLAISCILPAVTSLPMEDSGPGVCPRERRVMVRKRVYFSPRDRTYQSARRSRTAGLRMAGVPPSASRSRARAKISSKSVPTLPPTVRRSFISVVSPTFQPPPTGPTRWPSGCAGR